MIFAKKAFQSRTGTANKAFVSTPDQVNLRARLWRWNVSAMPMNSAATQISLHFTGTLRGHPSFDLSPLRGEAPYRREIGSSAIMLDVIYLLTGVASFALMVYAARALSRF